MEKGMEARILRLNSGGQPVDWLHWKEAACLHSRDMVCWSLGGIVKRVLGGCSRFTGQRSKLDLPAIIACHGSLPSVYAKSALQRQIRRGPPLTNNALFARDNHQCLYCGKFYSKDQLSRDHVHPVSRGGKDRWENVVAACKRCNQRKSNHLLSETQLELLALPFRPNNAEYLALINSARLRGDQLDFLRPQFSKNSRLVQSH